MEVFAVLLLLIILVLLLTFRSDTNVRLERIEFETRQLRQALTEASLKIVAKEPEVRTPAEPAIKTPEKEPEYWESSFKVLNEEPTIEIQEERIKDWLNETTPVEKLAETTPAAYSPTTSNVHNEEQAKSTFFERNPDLEKFIGENLISKIGIGILVLAIGYFVKFAIDQNWIGTIGRVAIGLLCGGILIALAHNLRNSYKAFSSVLVGGGLAVFYFTIALAYHQFHLFSQSTAFIVMLLITVFAVALSLWYDRQEVAIIALIGGFAAPFMVSDGSGNYKTLFIYLLLLNAGLLVIAYNKAWRLLNLLAFIFTVILVGGWLLSLDEKESATTYRNAFLFCTAFYLLFFAINLANNIKENKKFIASDFGILLANTSLYFAASITCLYYMNAQEYKGLFSAAMGVFNLVASYVLFRNRKVDTNILYLLIGITLTFVSLTAPLQLQGNFITLFWASEAVLLFWLYQKSKIEIIRISSWIVWACMAISLFMDWAGIYNDTTKALPIIINKGFITTVYAALASYCLYLLRQKELVTSTEKQPNTFASLVFYTSFIVLLFVAGALEINHQFQFRYPTTNFASLYLQLYTCCFVLVLILVKGTLAYQRSARIETAMLGVAVLVYLVLIRTHYDEQQHVLVSGKHSFLFNLVHWITALLMVVIVLKLITGLRKSADTTHNDSLATWTLCIVVIVFISVEMNLLVRALFYSKTNFLPEIQRVYNKTVLPILWGLSSFAFMWLGMKYKYRTLRIISLTLFSITLAKLFMFDIRNIPIAGKIAAFFCLGVLLLVVSFMYQRLKKIIIEDEQKPLL